MTFGIVKLPTVVPSRFECPLEVARPMGRVRKFERY